jgi:hypothetical protein
LLLVPVVILGTGWLVFSRYSRAVFQVAVMPSEPAESHGQPDRRRLGHLFATSITYLVFSWIAILVAIVLPYVTSVLLRSR